MASPDSTQVRARTWVLLAIDACDRAGLTPIPKARFHRLIFLSNCLAELFQAIPPSKRVLKYRRGPFYPDVQWQLDRLTAMGLAGVRDLSIQPDIHGPWMEADYFITSAGIALRNRIKETPIGELTALYIDELVFAFARLDGRRLDDVALHELNYAQSGIAFGALITFEDAESNLAIRKTIEIERVAPDVLAQRVREKMQIYLRYLERTTSAA